MFTVHMTRYHPPGRRPNRRPAVNVTARSKVVPKDYFGRSIRVGDVLQSVGWSSGGGFPMYATSTPLTVQKVNRTRVVVTGPNFVGAIAVLGECATIIERNGVSVRRADFGGIDRLTGEPFEAVS